MKLHRLLLAPLLLQACALPKQAPDSPAMTVDAADSLNIAGFHRTVDEKNKTKPAHSDSDVMEKPGSEHVARADYQPSKGPGAAYTAIHQALYKACPGGWNKQEEWTENDDGLFYLYISARCR